MIRAYKYRLLPTEEQKDRLIRWTGACRFIFNLALETKIAVWTSAGKNLTSYDLMKELKYLRQENDWLADCPAQSLESAITNLNNAYNSFFNGGGFPNFKKKNSRQSITFRQSSSVNGNKITLTKIGEIYFIKHRELSKGEIRSVFVSYTPAGNWFISILIKDERQIPNKTTISANTSVGIDLGLKSFATLSDGTSFDNPKFLFDSLKRLRIEQRSLQRCFKKGTKDQSVGYYKQKLVVAKLHEKIANQRKDFLHKVSAAIIKQYDTIVIEDLNISGMMKNNRLSRSIADVGWHTFITFLAYKAEWSGKNLIKIGRFDPSSKMCSICGYVFKELKLSDREWDCLMCGTHHDRDHNAAKNIKSFGLEAKPSTVNVNHEVERIGCESMPPFFFG